METQAVDDAANLESLPPAPVARRRPGIPLATGLLAVAVLAVLIALANPGRDVAESMLMMAVGGVPGGLLALILALYSSGSWRLVVASYFVGSAATVAAVRTLVVPQTILVPIAAASLLLLFAATVRWAGRKTGDSESD